MKNTNNDNLSIDLPLSSSQLIRALTLQEKVSAVGFDWPSWHGALDKVYEETDEVKAELKAVKSNNNNKIGEELGDLLFAVVNVIRHQKQCPEKLLKAASDKFETRYEYVESYIKKQGLTMQQASDEEMEAGWLYAKEKTKSVS